MINGWDSNCRFKELLVFVSCAVAATAQMINFILPSCQENILRENGLGYFHSVTNSYLSRPD